MRTILTVMMVLAAALAGCDEAAPRPRAEYFRVGDYGMDYLQAEEACVALDASLAVADSQEALQGVYDACSAGTPRPDGRLVHCWTATPLRLADGQVKVMVVERSGFFQAAGRGDTGWQFAAVCEREP